VAVLGRVSLDLADLALPVLPLGDWLALVPSALALAAVTIAEGLMIARRAAERHGDSWRPAPDLAALGPANVAAGLSSSFAVGPSTSRTAAMEEAGSRSQVPSLVLAAGATLLILFGTDLLALVPLPAIGAIIAVAVLRLLGVGELRELWRVS